MGFHGAYKITPYQTQSKEIASWMQQLFAALLLNTSFTETRNDEWG
jgi:hypothetical protein